MSELKADNTFVFGEECLAYKKSEADKVIAQMKSDIADLRDNKNLTDAILDERNAEIEELQKQVHDYAQGLYVIQAMAEKEARHHKYKRCLAMAMWCDEAYHRECGLNPEEMTDKEFYKQQIEFWPRWSSRWLAIAEKFKTNLTAQ